MFLNPNVCGWFLIFCQSEKLDTILFKPLLLIEKGSLVDIFDFGRYMDSQYVLVHELPPYLVLCNVWSRLKARQVSLPGSSLWARIPATWIL